LGTFEISIIGLVIFLLLAFQGVPIGFAFAIVGCAGIILLRGFDTGLSTLGAAPYTWAANSNLLAVPLFILMGQFVYYSGISSELFATAHKWVGRFPGGLAIATTLANTAFGACCGVSVAADATFATIAYPEMNKYKYDEGLATGCITAGGSLSSLIPPSAPFIVFGVITQSSIGKLFIGGIFAGLLIAFSYVMIIIIRCVRNPALGPAGAVYPWKEMLRSLTGLIGVLILFLIVMGGLFAGVFAPSEAGAVGAFGAFAIALARRKLNWRTFVGAVKESLRSSCFIIVLVTGAMIFSNFWGISGFSSMFKEWLTGLPFPSYAIMICILVMYIPLGMVMDALGMILLTVPIVFPVVVALGYDLIWFGVVVTIMAEMALISPPVAVNCYVVSGITKVPLGKVFWGVLPFFAAMFVCVMLVFAFPQIVLFLPSVMK
jgi:C4-dicarboxylate transporter, DctM subunit